MSRLTASSRLFAIDWMRGLVMVLMTVDHASHVFNRNEVMADSAYFGSIGQDLVPPGLGPQHFLTRWVTHLCAPTFVFLAGTVLALAVERRRERGESAWAIDRHLLARGALLVVLEVWMSIAFQVPVLQVLYAIGASILCMALLRRLPTSALLALSLGWIALGEALLGWIGLKPGGEEPSVGEALLFVNHGWPVNVAEGWLPLHGPSFSMIMYPLVPWLAILVLGWCFGRWLIARPTEEIERPAARLLLAAGLAALAAYVVQRVVNGYGNYWLSRTDETVLRWLQVSKYPPSLAFSALELGLMGVLLALLFRVQLFRGERASSRNPFLVFGQCALFYYLIHIHLIGAVGALVFGSSFESRPFGLWGAWLGALGALAVLYPACLWFRSLKSAHPRSVLRYL